ncbi:hypothetical protein DFQ27_000263 [Actinomortierella ambigua]|uniref:Uncharacterized protein n=1 Tax=Actinomortierella ambigua TaxID=1343610 RepID=A0A9P6QEB2_9FUNG|nr:hypothetical protein DFQ27_000263 [Actinomortierella ambigua]
MFDQAVVFLYNNPFAAAGPTIRWSTHELTVRRHAALLTTFLLEADPETGSDGDEDEDDGEVDGEEESKVDGALGDCPHAGDGSYSEDKEAMAKASERHRRFYLNYFQHYRYQNASLVPTEALRRVFPSIVDEDIPHLQRHLARAFMMHNPSQILSLSLNAPDMAYMDIQHAILSLSSLRFLQIDRLTALEAPQMECVMDCITRHNELHGTIKHLTLGGNHDSERYSEGDRSYLVKIVQAFPSLQTLVMSQWADAWSNIGAIPLTSLRRLVMDHGGGRPRLEDADFLSRCERLEILDLYVAEVDPFDELAKRYLTYHHQHHQMFDEQVMQGRTLTQAPPPIRGIPPIHKLYISGEGAHPHLLNAFESAPVALSQTLRVLKVSCLDRLIVDRPSLTWGGGPSIGLQLPFLQELQIQGDIGLEFPFALLRCCPNLISLRIVVNGLESCARPGNDLDPIWTLCKLQVLQLSGNWPITTAWLGQLATRVTGLKMLDLQWCKAVELRQVLEHVGRMPQLRRLGWITESPELVAEWYAVNPLLVIEPIPLQAYYI